MATIRINPAEIMSSGSQAESAKQKISSAKSGINAVIWKLDGKIKNRNNIAERLNTLVDTMGDIETKIARIKSTVDSNAKTYLWADAKLGAEEQELFNKISFAAVPGLPGILNAGAMPTNGFQPLNQQHGFQNNPMYFYNQNTLEPGDLEYNGICFTSPTLRDAYIRTDSGLPSEVNTATREISKELMASLIDDKVLKGLPVIGTVLDVWDVGVISYDYFSVVFSGDNTYATGVSLSRLGVKAVDVLAGLVPGLGYVSSPIAGIIDEKLSEDLKNHY